MSGFFLKRFFDAKPGSPRQPDLSHPHLKGCIAHWGMMEAAGALTQDQTPTGYHLVFDPGVSWQAGNIVCDGSNFSHLNGTGSFAHDIAAGDFSFIVRGWFKDFNTYLAIAANGRYDPAFYWRLANGPWGLIGFAGATFEADTVLATNTLYTLCFTRRAGVLYFYLDGRADGSEIYTRNLPNDLFVFNHNGSNAWESNCVLEFARLYDESLDEALIRDIYERPYAPFEYRAWTPTLEGVQPIPLIVDDSRHGSNLDAVDVESSYILQVDGASHASRLDDCAVTISEAIALLIDNMAHGSVLDEPLITPTYTLLPQALAHAHPLDECAAYWRVDLLANGLAHVSRMDAVDVQAAPEIVIDIDGMTHGHDLDAIALEYETTLSVDGLRHGHPVDAPDVSALLGLLTTLSRTDTAWRINAGQSVDNAIGVDAGWHVVEAIFDGAGSLLAIDGVPVAGNAGVRELQSLTLGAELDGSDRLTGDIGELRIYNGALTQVQRDKIRAQLQAKWL